MMMMMMMMMIVMISSVDYAVEERRGFVDDLIQRLHICILELVLFVGRSLSFR